MAKPKLVVLSCSSKAMPHRRECVERGKFWPNILKSRYGKMADIVSVPLASERRHKKIDRERFRDNKFRRKDSPGEVEKFTTVSETQVFTEEIMEKIKSEKPDMVLVHGGWCIEPGEGCMSASIEEKLGPTVMRLVELADSGINVAIMGGNHAKDIVKNSEGKLQHIEKKCVFGWTNIDDESLSDRAFNKLLMQALIDGNEFEFIGSFELYANEAMRDCHSHIPDWIESGELVVESMKGMDVAFEKFLGLEVAESI